jgi:hypothetical protein
MIDVQGLRKQYGDLVAVDGLTFSAPAGSIFGRSARTAPASRRPRATGRTPAGRIKPAPTTRN